MCGDTSDLRASIATKVPEIGWAFGPAETNDLWTAKLISRVGEEPLDCASPGRRNFLKPSFRAVASPNVLHITRTSNADSSSIPPAA